jgi:anti-sigma-K factor RskA
MSRDSDVLPYSEESRHEDERWQRNQGIEVFRFAVALAVTVSLVLTLAAVLSQVL